MSNIQRIIELFQLILDSSTEQIKKSQVELETYHSDATFIHSLLNIPLIEGMDQKVSKLAIAYTKTLMKEYTFKEEGVLLNNGVNMMFAYLENNSIAFKFRKQVSENLEYLIRIDKKQRISSAYQQNLISILNKAMEQNITDINYQYIVLMCKIMSDSIMQESRNPSNNFFVDSFSLITKLAFALFQFGTTAQNPEPSFIEQFIQLSKILSEVLQEYIKKIYYHNAKAEKVLNPPIFSELVLNAVALPLPGNELSSNLVYWRDDKNLKNNSLLNNFYDMKKNYTRIIKSSMTILIAAKSQNYLNHPLLVQGPYLINSFTLSLEELLKKKPYYKLTNIHLTNYMEQILYYLISCTRNSHFYKQIYELRSNIQNIVFEILAFSYDDYQKFNNDPEEFFNELIHTIQIDEEAVLKSKKKEIEKQMGTLEEDDEDDYSSLKSKAAELIKCLCKYVDGVLSELFELGFNVIEGKINSEYSSVRFLLILAIVRQQTREREQIKIKLSKIIFHKINELDLPKQQPQNMQYSLTLILLWRYFFYIPDYTHNFLDKVFIIIQSILNDHKLDQVPKLIACEIINMMVETKESEHMMEALLRLLNSILSAKKIYSKYVECIEKIIDKCTEYIPVGEQHPTLSNTIQNTSEILQKLLMNPTAIKHQKQVIQHLWNIFIAMSDSYKIVQVYRQNIYTSLKPIVNLIDGDNTLQIDENYFKIIMKMIKNSAVVTESDLMVIKILPSVFYKGAEKYQLRNAFQCLQFIIFYGIDLLKNRITDMQALLILCFESITHLSVNGLMRTEADCSQGLLILQSLIIECHSLFNQKIWSQIIQKIYNFITNTEITTDFFLSNLVSTLALILAYTHQNFPVQQNNRLLEIILSKYTHYTEQYACKIYILSMGELLYCYNFPYIQNNYIHIFDSIITLLKITSTKKAQPFTEEDMNNEQRQYQDLKKKVHNRLIDFDEFIYFRKIVEKIKEQNSSILEYVLTNIPKTKLEYYGEILTMQKVKNETRRILKIKKDGHHSTVHEQSGNKTEMESEGNSQSWLQGFQKPQTNHFGH